MMLMFGVRCTNNELFEALLPNSVKNIMEPNSSQPKRPKEMDTGKRSDCKSSMISGNLLPKTNEVLGESAFEFAPKDLQNINFLDATTRIGVDTVSSSLRNANYSIRSEPPNPKTEVSPWMNSTIDPDLERRPLEI
jgi:hypothetical protein